MINHSHKGTFIVFDGLDGSGKTTAIEYVYDQLTKLGHTVTKAKDPGTTDVGLKIRELTQRPEIDDMTQLLLFIAARHEMMTKVTIPALADGNIVLCDRYFYSTFIYQGMLKDMGRKVHVVSNLTGSLLRPDLTLIMDIPSSVSNERLSARTDNNHFDYLPLDTKDLIRREYRMFAQTEPEVRIIDASRTMTAVHEDIMTTILPLLQNTGILENETALSITTKHHR